MTEVVKFKAPSGDEMVMLPAAAYEQLVATAESAEDLATYDRVKRQLATGEDEMIPSEVADRLLAGENPIRVWREHRGLTAAALAAKADIGQGFLSQIETGKRDGTVGTLMKVAAALRVSIDDLVERTERLGDAQAVVAAQILRYLGSVNTATEAEIEAAVAEHGSQRTIMYSFQGLLRENRIGHTGAPMPGEPRRFFLPTAEELDDAET